MGDHTHKGDFMKKTSTILGIVLIAWVLVLSGCMTTFSSDSGQLSYAEVSGEEQGEISAEEGFIYIIHPTFIPISDQPNENIDLLIDPELTSLDANAVSNLQIDYGFTGIDYILSSFVPFLSWGTMQVNGTAVSQ